MMQGHETVTILMTLMRQLTLVMEHEHALLRGMRVDALRDIQAEKTALAEAYEIEVRRLRSEPHKLADLEPGVGQELALAMREFQASARANADELLAARDVVECIVRCIGDSVKGTAASYGGAHTDMRGDTSAKVVSLAVNREI